MNRGLRTLAGAAASAAALLVAAAPASAVDITPNTLADAYNDGPSTCSLREAVQASNSDAAFDGCPAGSGSDEIKLGDGVYQLSRASTGANDNTEGELDVTSGDTLTISHAGGGRAAIDGGDMDRVIWVQGGALLTVSGIEVRNGRVTSQTGAGIVNEGTLTMLGSTVSGNEILTNGYGAGIWSLSGAVALTNVTISGNTAPAASAGAGGLYVNSAGNTLTNVTVSGNDGGGGSGGGVNIGTAGTLTIKNTIIAGNTAAASPDCSKTVGGTFNSLDWNLIQTSSGCGLSTQSGDQLDVPAGLSGLADNGGPVPTHALSPGGNAVDKVGVSSCPGLTTDARGYPRPIPAGGRCDIGAYELTTCAGAPLNTPGPFGDCPGLPKPKVTPPAKKKCKKGRKLKKGKCVKKKRKKRK